MFKKVARIRTRVSFEALCANIDFCGEANFGMRNWSTPVNYKPNIGSLLEFFGKCFYHESMGLLFEIENVVKALAFQIMCI